MAYGKLIPYHRDLFGPENVSPTGRPHDMAYTQHRGGATVGAPKHGKQPGHTRVSKHPGRSTTHSAPDVHNLAAGGQTNLGQATKHGAPRQAGPSAPALVSKKVGAQTVKTHGQANFDGSHKDTTGHKSRTHSPPVEAHRNRAGQAGGMEAIRGQNMSYGLMGHLSGHQQRSTPTKTKIVHKKIGSRRMHDNY